MYQLLYPQQTALDKVWFSRLQPYVEELFTSLGASHEAINEYRQKFENAAFNPDLRPTHINVASYDARNNELQALKSELLTTETNQAVRLAYSLKIDELITQNNILIASANNDSDSFGRLNRDLYGAPNAAIFAAACDWIRHEASQSFGSNVPLIRSAAEQVLTRIPDLGGNYNDIVPNAHVFKQVRDSHFASGGYIDQLFGGLTIPDHVTPAIGDDITRAVIKAIGSTYELIDSTDEMWGVVHSRHAVARPVQYNRTRPQFMGIVAHEIGSHLLERENGLRQPLQLLSAGLDKYEASNEGRAFLREQIMYHSPAETLAEPSWEHIILLYVAAALGAGIHRQPYDFMSLYETFYPVSLLFQASRQPDNPVFAERRARDVTWHHCVRVAKGTDGNGGAYLKAMVYLDGNLTAWQLAATDPNIILFGDSGKFDISRSDHREILSALL
jgi:hypothetical protein